MPTNDSAAPPPRTIAVPVDDVPHHLANGWHLALDFMAQGDACAVPMFPPSEPERDAA